jgi:tetratricopeptide (TPR) repeat protein
LAARAAQAARRHAAGDLAGAVALCREILAVDLRHPDALHIMGLVAFQSGNAPLALQLIEGALAARSDFVAAWHDHGHILYVLGRFDEAARSARAALDVAPDLAAAWDLLARALAARGKPAAEVAACHAKAAAMAPADAKFLGNYAAFLYGRGELTQACRIAAQAEQSDANWPPMVLGNVLKAMGYPELAARRYARTRALCPAMAEAAASEAAARLQIGEWERGWDLWALRPDLDKAMAYLPLWRGEGGTRVILYEDQGMGDAIQFMRFIPFALQQAGSIAALRLRAPLCRLVAEAFPSVTVIDETAPLPPAEARARLSDLPVLARLRIETIPQPPYLMADSARRAAWRDRLAALPGPRIGLIHAGNPRFRNDAARSIAPEHLTPLFDCGASIVHMQTDRQAELPGFDAAPFLRDFADTAAPDG